MKLSNKWMLLLGAMTIALVTLSFACGGDDDDDAGDDEASPAATATPGGDGGDVTFDVSMGDNFFDPEGFTVPTGASVTFNLTNDGSAIHNMRVAGPDGDYNTEDDAVSEEELVSPGDPAVLEWTAPSDAGEIFFQCDLHPTDMLGTITVE